MTRLRGICWLFSHVFLLIFVMLPTVPIRQLAQVIPTPAAPASPRFPSFNPSFPPPSNWNGHVFVLSQNYPTQPPPPEARPWESIDFHQQPFDYLQSVLTYALEGNTTVDFDVQHNPIRPWYHAPWLHTGCFGREFVRGLTRERSSRPGELHPNQTSIVDNWAVGFYNPAGGYTVGQVWNTSTGVPEPVKAVFPVGTVTFKLLFTTALTTEVPFLANSLEWEANIYPRTGSNPCPPNQPPAARQNQIVRLLQVDVAVRDNRATETGWVFGTFMYNAAAPGMTVWERLVPVGVMWGNDPTIKTDLNRTGAFVNADLRESVINPVLVTQAHTMTQQAVVMHLGLGGRLNGPVDNPGSSCMSCHGRASYPGQALLPRNAAPDRYTEANFALFFANLPAGTGPVTTTQGPGVYLDYSLQLAAGLEAYCRENACSNISIATTVPGVTATAEETVGTPTSTASPEATPVVATVAPSPQDTTTASPITVYPPPAPLAIPNISREGNPDLISQPIQNGQPEKLPNTNSPQAAHTLVVVVLIAALLLVAGVLVRRRGVSEQRE